MVWCLTTIRQAGFCRIAVGPVMLLRDRQTEVVVNADRPGHHGPAQGVLP